MSGFKTNFRHLRGVLIFCFYLKKTAAEAHTMLSSTYDEATLSERMCREWFQHFKSGDFDVEDRHGGGKEKIFEDFEWKALNTENSCQTHKNLLRNVKLGGLTPAAVLSRRCSFRLTFVSIDGRRPSSSVFPLL